MAPFEKNILLEQAYMDIYVNETKLGIIFIDTEIDMQ